MLNERAQKIRANRDKVRGDMRKLISESSRLAVDRTALEELAKKPDRLALLSQVPMSKKNMQRKKSLNINILPRSFEMSECGEIEINSDFGTFYELKEKIDEGAQSVVYRCQERKMGKEFAVKVTRTKERDLIQTLKKQFLIAKNLELETILKTHNLFIDEKIGISHLVMEYSSFENLRIFMLKKRILTESKISRILIALLRTLAYLHAKGICHRDVKPENILYDPGTNTIKLIDFQICKMIRYEHQRLEMCTNTGTLYYKAPEMFLGGSYGCEIDVWAVGVLCYQMVTGQLPFRGVFEKETIRQIQESELSFQSKNMTDSCVNFIKKCLERNSEMRMTAKEALQTPFLLKCRSTSTSGSPKLKRNGSLSDVKVRKSESISLNCFDETTYLANRDCLTPDSGIRLIVDFSHYSEDKNNEFL